MSKKNIEKEKDKQIKENKVEKEEVLTSANYINTITLIIDNFIKNINADNKYDEKIINKFKKYIKYINKYIEKKNKELDNKNEENKIKKGFKEYPDGSTYTGELKIMFQMDR